MAEITIEGREYFSYVTVDDADAYLAVSPLAANWRLEPDGERAKHVVAASRLIDRQRYRAGYRTQAERAAVPAFADATCEIAAQLASGDTSILSSISTAPEVKRIKAGTVEVENYDRVGGARFGGAVYELLTAYLEAPDPIATQRRPTVGGASAFGTDAVSTREDVYGFARNP